MAAPADGTAGRVRKGEQVRRRLRSLRLGQGLLGGAGRAPGPARVRRPPGPGGLAGQARVPTRHRGLGGTEWRLGAGRCEAGRGHGVCLGVASCGRTPWEEASTRPEGERCQGGTPAATHLTWGEGQRAGQRGGQQGAPEGLGEGGNRLRACGGDRIQPGPEGDAGPEGLLTVTSGGVLPCAQLEIPLWNVLESPRKVAGK